MTNNYHIRPKLKLLDRLLFVSLSAIVLLWMNVPSYNLGGSGIQIPANIYTWLGALLFMFIAVIKILVTKRLKLQKTSLATIVFMASLFIPLIYTDRLFLETQYIRLSGVIGGILFLVALNQLNLKKYQQTIIFVVLVSTLLQTIWGLYQAHIATGFSMWFIGFSRGTPFGVFQQVNVFTIYLVTGILFAIYYFFELKPLVYRVLCLLLIAVNMHLIDASGSESGRLVGFISVSIALFYYAYQNRSQWRHRSFWASIGAVPAIFVLLSVINVQNDMAPANQGAASDVISSVSSPAGSSSVGVKEGAAIEREGSSLAVTTSSVGAVDASPAEDIKRQAANFGSRPTMYRSTLNAIMDAPLAGHGIGSFAKVYSLYQGEFLLEHPDAPAEFRILHPHNELLYWTLEFGVLPVISFLVFFMYIFYQVFLGRLSPKHFLLVLPIVLHMNLELPIYHSAVVYLMVFILLVMASPRHQLNNQQYSVKLGLPIRLISVAIGVIMFAYVSLFLLSTLYAARALLAYEFSDKQDISVLRGISNRAAFRHRFEFEIFNFMMKQARETGRMSVKDVNSLIAWSYSTIQYVPLETTYRNFIDALVLIEKYDAAYRYAAEGKLIYPRSSQLVSRYETLHQRQSNLNE